MDWLNVCNSLLDFRHFAVVIYKYGILTRSVSAICWQLLGLLYRSDRWQFHSARMVGQDKPPGFGPLFDHGTQPAHSTFQPFDIRSGLMCLRMFAKNHFDSRSVFATHTSIAAKQLPSCCLWPRCDRAIVARSEVGGGRVSELDLAESGWIGEDRRPLRQIGGGFDQH